MSKPFGLAVGAFIQDCQGRYLLLQRSRDSRHFAGQWETPGGKVESGEPFDVAVLREVREETGLSVTLDGFAGAAAFELETVKVVVLYVYAHTADGDLRLSSEHDDSCWVSLPDFSSRSLTPALTEVMDRLRPVGGQA